MHEGSYKADQIEHLRHQLIELESSYTEMRQEIIDQLREAKSGDVPVERLKVAQLLHDIDCRHNHVDECDWYDDDGNWQSEARQKYLSYARYVLRRHQATTAINILESLVNIL